MGNSSSSYFPALNKINLVATSVRRWHDLDLKVQHTNAAPAQQQQLLQEWEGARNLLAVQVNDMAATEARVLGVTVPSGLPLDGARFIQLPVVDASTAVTGMQALVHWDQTRKAVDQRLRRRMRSSQWPGLSLALVWAVVTLPVTWLSCLLAWCGIRPYTRWMQSVLALVAVALASIPLAWAYEFTPPSDASHAAAVVALLWAAIAAYAEYHLPSKDIDELLASSALAAALARQLQQLGLLRFSRIAFAVQSDIDSTMLAALK